MKEDFRHTLSHYVFRGVSFSIILSLAGMPMADSVESNTTVFTKIYNNSSMESVLLYAPEICNNGIDDDGDGLIDLYDPDCFCCQADAPTLNTIDKKTP